MGLVLDFLRCNFNQHAPAISQLGGLLSGRWWGFDGSGLRPVTQNGDDTSYSKPTPGGPWWGVPLPLPVRGAVPLAINYTSFLNFMWD